MISPHTLYVVVRHGWLLLHGGLARWRLETFGLYMPSYPHTRPWWRINRRALRQLFRQRRAYACWLAEMDALQRHGSQGWWRLRLGAGYEALRAYELAADEAAATGD